jgi:hypothetical protein
MRRAINSMLVLVTLLALAFPVLGQNETPPDVNRLLRLLRTKGIITEQEFVMVSHGPTADDVQQRLTQLLLTKGVISRSEYESMTVNDTADSAAPAARNTGLRPAVLRTDETAALAAGGGSPEVATAQTSKPAETASVIPAVAPLRVLPITIPKKGGLVPDIKLGSGASLRPYGFFKISEAYQTASSGGPTFGSNDFPQGPLLLGDTGPDGGPQFHIKDRAFRAGLDFEWPDALPNLTLTGKFEFDFEGNFTNVNNRNISSNRSSQPSLRLAWVRMDSKLGALPWFAQFGQDWSIFGSSTLMDLFETTGFGFAQGNLYERMPMFRTGVQFGQHDFKFQPEFALALSSFGEPGLDADQRTRFGGRVGPESGRPEIQARAVVQFPFSKASGVAPAQIIFSVDNAERDEIVPFSSLAGAPAAIRTAFPRGLRLSSQRNAWTGEAQLPTPYLTLVGKFYRGGDLRYYFMGEFNDVFTDLGGLPSSFSATSFSGRAIPIAIAANGTVVPSRLEPVRGQGGFVELGIPLSRIAGVRPNERGGTGWTIYLTYGVDSALARDSVRANGLLRTDHGSAQLRFKLNKWVTFAQETTYLDTRTADNIRKPFRGLPAHVAHAWRNEFGPIFTF